MRGVCCYHTTVHGVLHGRRALYGGDEKVLLPQERDQIAEYGRRMISAGLSTGTGGNLSLYDRSAGLIAASPSAVDYDRITAEDVAVVDLEGRQVEGRGRPTSELNFHLAVYRARSAAGAVIHTHSVYATTLACLGWELPPVHYLIGFAGRKVPLAPYKLVGSTELGRAIVEVMGDSRAVLMANHGLVAWGESLERAFTTAEECELVARIYYQARAAGAPILLTDRQLDELLPHFEKYGKQS